MQALLSQQLLVGMPDSVLWHMLATLSPVFAPHCLSLPHVIPLASRSNCSLPPLVLDAKDASALTSNESLKGKTQQVAPVRLIGVLPT